MGLENISYLQLPVSLQWTLINFLDAECPGLGASRHFKWAYLSEDHICICIKELRKQGEVEKEI